MQGDETTELQDGQVVADRLLPLPDQAAEIGHVPLARAQPPEDLEPDRIADRAEQVGAPVNTSRAGGPHHSSVSVREIDRVNRSAACGVAVVPNMESPSLRRWVEVNTPNLTYFVPFVKR